MTAFKKIFNARVLRNIIITVLVYILLSFGLTVIIYDLTFPRYDPQDEADVSAELSDLVEARKHHFFKSGENELKGYLYGESGRALVVLIPGFYSSADDYLQQIKSFCDHGFGVFAFDTTGSCESEGESSVGFPQTLLDLDAALDYIESNACFGFERIFLFGHSRGGYAACSAREGEHDIDAVVSVAGANSAMEAVSQRASDYVGFLAYGNYPMLWIYQAMLFGSENASFRADEAISESNVPVLIVQGSEDTTSPPDKCSIYSHKDEIASDKVEYIYCETPGQNGHTDLLFDGELANAELMESINAFFDRCLLH